MSRRSSNAYLPWYVLLSLAVVGGLAGHYVGQWLTR